ncbi:SH3 beta-barrel fold-containing protein [Rufibacter quisquiliarum]|uniref:Uncharacterized protein n=1 Tax=Rufibacter quisquiliarum TaxID=1549639 RepID=A0A839GNQ6_9BACT|nr:SH3 beta-barrel fold-containing protein [Rufibacter quisquiliarum]MBA9076068.1 hypothetical protein [Rufibacter quisquiliarum]
MEKKFNQVKLHTRKGKKWGQREYLMQLLAKTAVRFTYITVTDGSKNGGSPKGRTRLADGTRNLALVPKSKHPKSFRPYSSRLKTYYDYTKKAWRSFRTMEVVSIISYKDPKTGEILPFSKLLDVD